MEDLGISFGGGRKMPGTVASAPAGGDLGGWSSGEALQRLSLANSSRVSSVMENLVLQLQHGNQYDPTKFSQLCIDLARGIDYAIGNSEVLANGQHLAATLKQICQRRNNDDVQTAIMVLMFSVKNACQLGWFSDEDSEEFLALANEIASCYGSVRDTSARNSNLLSLLSNIMTKFFPLIKLGQILAFVEVEPGFEALVHDFQISKKMTQSPCEKIMLLVAQTDIIQTSACIISPQQVNFLLNGEVVDKRTNVTMDSGPQMPTDVTRMLNYGTNLLQVLGQFNGHYLIAIAFMSVRSSPPDATTILDHVQPAVSENDSDLDIIEGPSRISLNCPISYTRIKTPVKGQSCKHLQCFDFHNFVDINSRRPSWRCPHCNQNVCYSDIRIDQNICKMLREVGDNISEVIISAEGSWKAVLENDDNVDSYKDETYNILEEGSVAQDCSQSKFVDLINDNYEMDSTPLEIEDRKPSHSSLNIPSVPSSSNFPLEGNVNVSQSVPVGIEDQIWSRILNSPPITSTSIPDVQTVGYSLESNPASHLEPPYTNALLPACGGSDGNRGYANYASTSMHSQFSSRNNFQIQDSYAPTLLANEYGSVPAVQSHPSRAPIAVQALPALLPTTGQQHRLRNNFNSLNVNSLPPSSTMPTRDDTVHRNLGRSPHLSRHHGYPHQIPNLPTMGPVRHPSTIQNQVRVRPPFLSPTPLPSPAVIQSSLRRGINRPSPVFTHFQNEHLQQALNSRVTQNIRLPNPSQQQFRHIPAQRAAPMVRQSVQSPSPPTVVPLQPSFDKVNFGGRAHPISSTTDGVTHVVPSEQDWRPTGQMRGSLSGRAYDAALDKFIIRPTQHEPSRPGSAAENNSTGLATVSNVDPTRRV